MAKNISLFVDDVTKEEWGKVKTQANLTWVQILKLGIETIKKKE